ncbi:Hypodermin-B [Zancudomyces culisetae]|uniref:Hypodermin-B n=1 Tax=Zancudomyces culisetae TaxID=1213189 RepID=A0A1R1PZJ5_ZANCU|nr:Hypodermin-B [Zancudomyces culisetae]|eukprot:OMH86359.1 Hypodermin-B [Zancudomyces culisetae]
MISTLLLWYLSISQALGDNVTDLQPNTGPKKSGERIVGGLNANIVDFPFAVTIYNTESQKLEKDGVIDICTGSLLKPNIVVTAAHCVTSISDGKTPIDTKYLYISAGSTQLRLSSIPSSSTPGLIDGIYGTNKIVINENYDPSIGFADIAILFLTVSIESKNGIPINAFNGELNINNDVTWQQPNLNSGKSVSRDAELVVAGWGVDSPKRVVSSNLKYVTYMLPNITSTENSYHLCTQLSSIWSSNNYLATPLFCIPNVNSIGPCFGDSGGPLTVRDVNNHDSTYLLGITSAIRFLELSSSSSGGSSGQDQFVCGRSDTATYYTNVYYYLDWISAVTNVNRSSFLDQEYVFTGKGTGRLGMLFSSGIFGSLGMIWLLFMTLIHF